MEKFLININILVRKHVIYYLKSELKFITNKPFNGLINGSPNDVALLRE